MYAPRKRLLSSTYYSFVDELAAIEAVVGFGVFEWNGTGCERPLLHIGIRMDMIGL